MIWIPGSPVVSVRNSDAHHSCTFPVFLISSKYPKMLMSEFLVWGFRPFSAPPPLLICRANQKVKQCKNSRITIAKPNRNIPFINPIDESSSFKILLRQVKLPNMVAITIYGLKEVLMHVPEPMVYQAFVGLLHNLNSKVWWTDTHICMHGNCQFPRSPTHQRWGQ